MLKRVSSRRHFFSALLVVVVALASGSIYSVVTETKLRAQADPKVIAPRGI